MCYTDKDKFIVHAKTYDIYKDILKANETRFGTSNYKLNKPLMNKKAIAVIKDKLGGKIMK